MIVKSDSLVSEHEYLFGTKKANSKVVDVKSTEDFPTLGNDLGSMIPLSSK